jgi:hypothetical protein
MSLFLNLLANYFLSIQLVHMEKYRSQIGIQIGHNYQKNILFQTILINNYLNEK